MAKTSSKKTAGKAKKTADNRQRELRALKRGLEQAGKEFDSFPQLAKSVQRVYKSTGFDSLAREIIEIGEGEIDPPDDLQFELEKLQRKLDRIQKEIQQGEPKVLERKFPWRYQINVPFLLDFLLEVVQILKKLYRRDVRPQG